jgi:hypothetical protein
LGPEYDLGGRRSEYDLVSRSWELYRYSSESKYPLRTMITLCISYEFFSINSNISAILLESNPWSSGGTSVHSLEFDGQNLLFIIFSIILKFIDKNN